MRSKIVRSAQLGFTKFKKKIWSDFHKWQKRKGYQIPARLLYMTGGWSAFGVVHILTYSRSCSMFWRHVTEPTCCSSTGLDVVSAWLGAHLETPYRLPWVSCWKKKVRCSKINIAWKIWSCFHQSQITGAGSPVLSTPTDSSSPEVSGRGPFPGL